MKTKLTMVAAAALAFAAVALLWTSSGPPAPEMSRAVAEVPQARSGTYGKIPLAFEANQGQVDERVEYLARGPGYNVFLGASELVLTLAGGDDGPEPAVLRMALVGGQPAPPVEALEELPGKVHYFIGDDPDDWQTDVPTFTRVAYRDVYPGIDLVLYGNPRVLEYDLVVAPGANPAAITIAFDGIDRLEIDEEGDLVLRLGETEIVQPRPFVYQEIDGEIREVGGRYVRRGEDRIGFEVDNHDPRAPLVIDPKLVYSTYWGGSGFDQCRDIAVDGSGCAYVTGVTDSTNFPASGSNAGGYDAFVTKLNAAGSATVYSVYLGGSGDDQATDLAVDGSGCAYVTGMTASSNFPTASAYQSTHGGGPTIYYKDAFVTKLNASGSALVYSTFLGASHSDEACGIAVDASGAAYVTGSTLSWDFPVTTGAYQTTAAGNYDTFVAKLQPSGAALAYSTRLGGEGADFANAIAVDSSGQTYVTGYTGSNSFPVRNALQSEGIEGSQDAYVTKLNASGSALVYSTYLAGNDLDRGYGIAADASGYAYVVGYTRSLYDFPTANALQSTNGAGENPTHPNDAFIAKIKPDGSGFVYSTYLGGYRNDNANDVAVDGSGNAYVTGFLSGNFPRFKALSLPGSTRADAGENLLILSTDQDDTVLTGTAKWGSDWSAFVTLISSDGSSMVFSTQLGGLGTNEWSAGIALDGAGDVYVAGQVKMVDATKSGFPLRNALQTSYGGGTLDGFVAKIDPDDMTDVPKGRWLEGTTVLVDWTYLSEFTLPLDLDDLAALSIGDHTFTFEVTDGTETVTDTVVVTVDNSPPVAAPSGAGIYESGPSSVVTLGGQVADYDGETLTYEWRKGTTALFDGEIDTTQGGTPVGLDSETIGTTTLGVGVHTIDLAVDDGTNDEVVASIVVEITTAQAPTMSLSASHSILWPPNHSFTEVTIQTNASDDSGPVTLSVEIECDEPPELDKDGDPIPAYEVVSVNNSTGVIVLNLRADRSGKGDGRTYTITITATDGSDNSSTATVVVTAPHDARKK